MMSSSNQTYKELAIPFFKETFDCIDEVMQEMNVPYYLIGVSAIALELLRNGIKPVRGTKDIDFAVMISSMDEYENIVIKLKERGFHKIEAPWTLFSEKFNTNIDLLPFGEIEQSITEDYSRRNIDLHMFGFQEVMEEAVQIPVDEKIANIPPLPGMIILKLIAWSDRPEERGDDLPDILKIIEHFYQIAWDEIVTEHFDTLDREEIDEKIIAAEVLGRKAKLYINKSEAVSERVMNILKANLRDVSNSAIAKSWAKKLNADVDYAFSILSAFQKGLVGNR